MNKKLNGQIRVLKMPEKEWPEWVQQAWVGLELPIETQYPLRYAVDHDAAMVILKAAHPKAAEWLEAESFCQQLEGKGHIVFAFKKEDVEVLHPTQEISISLLST